MADILKFPKGKPPGGHPLQQVAAVADRAKAVASVLPDGMAEAALIVAAAEIVSGRARNQAAQELALAQVGMVLKELRDAK